MMSGKPARLPLLLWAWVSMAILIISLLALTALQYRMPHDAGSTFGLNHDGVRIFQQQLFGHQIPGMDLRTYMLAFRLLLGIAWISYALAVILGLRGTTPAPKMIIGLISFLAVSLAILWPASLSNDSSAYIAYARMKVLYGQNPHTSFPEYLLKASDPIGKLICWNVLSPCGSVWSMLTVGVVTLLRHAGTGCTFGCPPFVSCRHSC